MTYWHEVRKTGNHKWIYRPMATDIVEGQFEAVLQAIFIEMNPSGFGKRGKRLYRTCQENLNIIEFQRSLSNDGLTVRFTVNIGILQSRLALLREIKLSQAGTPHAHLRARIGGFLPEPRDVWWTLTPDTKQEKAIEEVSVLLKQKVVPYLDEHSSDAALIKLWESGRCPGLTERECKYNLSLMVPSSAAG